MFTGSFSCHFYGRSKLRSEFPRSSSIWNAAEQWAQHKLSQLRLVLVDYWLCNLPDFMLPPNRNFIHSQVRASHIKSILADFTDMYHRSNRWINRYFKTTLINDNWASHSRWKSAATFHVTVPCRSSALNFNKMYSTMTSLLCLDWLMWVLNCRLQISWTSAWDGAFSGHVANKLNMHMAINPLVSSHEQYVNKACPPWVRR
jgi:hypothetical protein